MKRLSVLQYLWLLFLVCMSLPARAALKIEIVGAGENQIPVSIVPLAGEERLAHGISSVVAADLARSGLFKLVDPAGRTPHEPKDVVYANWPGVDALGIGSGVDQGNGRISVGFRLLDTV